MAGHENTPVSLVPARTGRHRSTRPLDPDELVRVEIRMPASAAARLFDCARAAKAPISRTASELIVEALDARGGDAST